MARVPSQLIFEESVLKDPMKADIRTCYLGILTPEDLEMQFR